MASPFDGLRVKPFKKALMHRWNCVPRADRKLVHGQYASKKTLMKHTTTSPKTDLDVLLLPSLHMLQTKPQVYNETYDPLMREIVSGVGGGCLFRRYMPAVFAVLG